MNRHLPTIPANGASHLAILTRLTACAFLCLSTSYAGNTPPQQPPRMVEQIELPMAAGKPHVIEWHGVDGIWKTDGKLIFPDKSLFRVDVPRGARRDGNQFRATQVANQGTAPENLVQEEIRFATGSGQVSTLALLNSTQAVITRGSSAWSATYEYVLSGPNSAEIILKPLARGKPLEKWVLQFANGGLGKACVTLEHGNDLRDTTSGGFVIGRGAGLITSAPATLPISVGGSHLILVSEGGVQTLQFTQNVATLTSLEGQPLSPPSAYTYELDDAQHGTLTLSGGNGQQSVSYQFSVSADQTATFVRGGGTNDVQTGGLVQPLSAGAPPSTTPGPCDAPASLANRTLKINGLESTPEQLEFGTDTGLGRKNTEGSASVKSFGYLYARVDESKATLRTSTALIDGDQVDEFELVFAGGDDCSGTFQRKTFRNGTLATTTSGTFGPG